MISQCFHTITAFLVPDIQDRSCHFFHSWHSSGSIELHAHRSRDSKLFGWKKKTNVGKWIKGTRWYGEKKKKKSLKAQWPSTEEQIQTVKVSERQWRKQNHVPRMSSCTYKQTDRLDVIVSRYHYSTINKCYVHPRFPFSLQAWLRDLKKKKRHFPSQSLPSYLDKSCAQHVQSINGGGVFRLFDSSCRFQIIIIKRGVTLSSQKKRKVRWQQTVALSKHTSKMVAMAMPVLEIAFAYTKWNTVVGCN